MNGVSKWRTSAGKQPEEGGGEGMHFKVNENNWPLVSRPLQESVLCTLCPMLGRGAFFRQNALGNPTTQL